MSSAYRKQTRELLTYLHIDQPIPRLYAAVTYRLNLQIPLCVYTSHLLCKID